MSAPVLQLQINGQAKSWTPGEAAPTVAALLGWLDLGERRVAVERNGAIVPRAEHDTAHVADGDALEIVTFVGGG